MASHIDSRCDFPSINGDSSTSFVECVADIKGPHELCDADPDTLGSHVLSRTGPVHCKKQPR
jgi:hypothetical protein